MGKTSILMQLPRLLGPEFAPSFIDCQYPAVTGSEASLLRYLTTSISSGLHRRHVVVQPLTSRRSKMSRMQYSTNGFLMSRNRFHKASGFYYV